ncbi:DUF2782 domain-containing protein [Oxalobacteraceae bacterium OM1]|nr:DUF2782 domain-containing protein [Oxalobacteraceae bacterium OM1]
MLTRLAPAIAAGLLASLAIPVAAQAQQQQQRQRPSDAPPTMERLEEGPAPEVNIKPPEQRTKITEQRANGGEVTEVQVQTGRSHYVLKPNAQHGAMPGDGQASNLRAAQFPVAEFDLFRRDEEKDRQAAEDKAAGKLPPAPPPPTQK